MKYKSFSDDNKEFSSGNKLELLNSIDKVSARSINRPTINLYENQEEIYNILNTLIKSSYGLSENSILPNIYEEFAPEGFLVNSFFLNNKYYLRIPTGAITLRNINENDNINNYFYKYGEKNYKNINDDFIKDEFNSFIYSNKPNINLLERQLASIIDLDLDDSYNDIKVEAKELPVTYLIYEVGAETKLPVVDENGNFIHITDNFGRALYKCNEDKAIYFVDKNLIFTDERDVNIPEYGNLPKIMKYYYSSDITVHDKADMVDKDNSFFLTYKIEDADVAKDRNGNTKKCIGYCATITENAIRNKTITSLPNTKEKSYIDVYLRNDISGKIEFRINNKFLLEFDVGSSINDSLINAINLYEGDLNLSARKISNIEKSLNGVRITFEDSFINDFDNYTYSFFDEMDHPLNDLVLGSLNQVPVNKTIRQEYYRNIFELVNGFLGNFKSSIVHSTSGLARYISCETLLNIEKSLNLSVDNKQDYYIYYDLNGDIENNKKKDNYDITGRLFSSDKKIVNNKNYILLFTVNIKWNEEEQYSLRPKVTGITYNVKVLDNKLLKTKRAELSTLDVSLRSELKGDISLSSSRSSINILDSIRSKSPTTRLLSKGATSDKKPEYYNGEDDNPSNFEGFEIEKNYKTGTDNIKYFTNKEDSGLVIDNQKGILLFNGYSEKEGETIKPIEILSENGNINILNNNSETSKISIRNNKDKASNLIDIKGLTKIRSENDNQLAIEALNTQKSTAIKFKTSEKELGRVQFKEDTDGTARNVIEVGSREIINSTDAKTTMTNNLDVIGNTVIKDKDPDTNSTFELNRSKISSIVTSGTVENKAGDNYSKITSDGTITNTAKKTISNTVGDNSSKITSDGKIENASTASISNTVGENSSKISSDGTIHNSSSKSITNISSGNSIIINGNTEDDSTANQINIKSNKITSTAGEGNISTISSDGTITNTAVSSIANTAGTSITSTAGEGNSIKISGGADNQIDINSDKIIIDNENDAGTVEIATTNGAKKIDIGNNINGSNVSIKAGDGSKGSINLDGTTNINTTGTKNTSIGNSVGEGNASSVTIEAGSGGVKTSSTNLITNTVGNNSLNIYKTGDKIDITSANVNITGDVKAFNNMTSNSKVSVTNETTLKNTLTVDGATNLSGDLEVTGKNKTTLNGTLSVTNATTLSSLETTGNAKLSTIIGADGSSAGVKGATSIGKTLSVTNGAVLSSLETTDKATLSTINTVTGNTSIGKTLSVTNGAVLSSLETTDKATLSKIVGEIKDGKETAGVKGATSIGGTLSVTGNAVLNSLETTDKATFGVISKVGDDTSISGKLTVNGDVTVGNAKTNVAEATGKLTVHGDSYVPNITTASTDYTIANKKYVDDTTAALDTHIGKGVGDNNDSAHGSTAGSSTDNGKNKIVQRDSNGNFYAGTITAELHGNATTASSWQTARKFKISDGTNNGTTSSVNGSSDITLKLPSTIIADLAGNADSATKAAKVSLGGEASLNIDRPIAFQSAQTINSKTDLEADVLNKVSGFTFNPYTNTLKIKSGNTTGSITATEYSGKANTAVTADKVAWTGVTGKPFTSGNVLNVANGGTGETNLKDVSVGSAAVADKVAYSLTITTGSNKETQVVFDGSKENKTINIPAGPAAGFAAPTATTTTLDAGKDASVSVSATGTNEAKKFSFAFGIPRGPQGIDGPSKITNGITATSNFTNNYILISSNNKISSIAQSSIVAGSASKLTNTTNIGSLSNPVYFTSGGVPAAITSLSLDGSITGTSITATGGTLKLGLATITTDSVGNIKFSW